MEGQKLAMSGRIDEIIEREDGWRETIRYRASDDPARVHAQMRFIYDPSGQLREIWHEILDATGNILHRHQVPISPKRDKR
jgi:hypothetical protein